MYKKLIHSHAHTHSHTTHHTVTHTLTHTQLLEAYRSLQKEQEELKVSSAESEKQAKRKLEEMKEVQSLDQAAKAHMEEAFRLGLEEKDEKINVMATQVGRVDQGMCMHVHHFCLFERDFKELLNTCFNFDIASSQRKN